MTDKMVMDFIVNNMSYLIGALGVLMIIMYFQWSGNQVKCVSI